MEHYCEKVVHAYEEVIKIMESNKTSGNIDLMIACVLVFFHLHLLLVSLYLFL